MSGDAVEAQKGVCGLLRVEEWEETVLRKDIPPVAPRVLRKKNRQACWARQPERLSGRGLVAGVGTHQGTMDQRRGMGWITFRTVTAGSAHGRWTIDGLSTRSLAGLASWRVGRRVVLRRVGSKEPPKPPISRRLLSSVVWFTAELGSLSPGTFWPGRPV